MLEGFSERTTMSSSILELLAVMAITSMQAVSPNRRSSVECLHAERWRGGSPKDPQLVASAEADCVGRRQSFKAPDRATLSVMRERAEKIEGARRYWACPF